MTRRRIMVADDSRLMRGIIKSFLGKHGFEIAGEAKSGPEAVELYGRIKPDLLTLDWNMPGMNGFDVARAILGEDPRAVILMVTSLRQKLLEEEALQMGVKAMIGKPFTREYLVKTVQGLLPPAK